MVTLVVEGGASFIVLGSSAHEADRLPAAEANSCNLFQVLNAQLDKESLLDGLPPSESAEVRPSMKEGHNRPTRRSRDEEEEEEGADDG